MTEKQKSATLMIITAIIIPFREGGKYPFSTCCKSREVETGFHNSAVRQSCWGRRSPGQVSIAMPSLSQSSCLTSRKLCFVCEVLCILNLLEPFQLQHSDPRLTDTQGLLVKVSIGMFGIDEEGKY